MNAATFVITGLLGGIAGALIGASVGTLSPLLTTPLTVKGLIVTVIGGLGSIPGAIVAGLLVGGFENLFQMFRGVTERDLYVMLLLFVFLVFRPGGIFATAQGGTRQWISTTAWRRSSGCTRSSASPRTSSSLPGR